MNEVVVYRYNATKTAAAAKTVLPSIPKEPTDRVVTASKAGTGAAARR